MSDRTRGLLRNVFSNWAAFALNIVIAFLMAPFVVRSLGDTYYGLWIILNQFTGYLGVLDLGMRSSVVKYVAGHHAKGETCELNAVVQGATRMYSGAAVLALTIAAGAAYLLPLLVEIEQASTTTVRFVVVLAGISMAVGLQFNAVYGVLMGIQRYDVFNRIGVVSSLARTGLIVLALKSGYGVVGLSVVQLASILGTCLAAYAAARRLVPGLRLTGMSGTSGVYRKILDYSIASFFVAISQKVVFQTDALVIGGHLGASAVTYFALPATLLEYVRRFAAAMTETFVPLTSALKARAAIDEVRELLLRGTRIATLIGIPMCVGCLFLGVPFIAVWVGPQYASQGGAVLVILALTQLVSIPHLPSREILNGLGFHRLNAYCYATEAIANLVLSLWLVRVLGIVGVAWGTAIPHAILVTLVFPRLICRALGLTQWSFFRVAILPPVLSGIPFAVCLLLLASYWPPVSLWDLVLCGAISAPCFCVPAWFIGLRSEDRLLVGRVLSALLRREYSGRNPPTKGRRHDAMLERSYPHSRSGPPG